MPKHLCNYPGCKALVDQGQRFCDKHKTADSRYRERNRKTSYERGYNNAWRRARKVFLQEHPLCAECERKGLITPATVVDHIKPHKGDRELFWDESNWQPLCKSCHDRKTAIEDGGFGSSQSLLRDG